MDTVTLIDGTREDAGAAGEESTFTARLSDAAREAYNARFPDRFAFKHAHSQVNPEKDWGKNVLQSVEFAFYVLNDLHGESGPGGKVRRTLTPENTMVIASSVSNGGGASVRAAEQDKRGLIDGIAVSEPNVNPEYDPRFTIVQGDGEPLRAHSRSLLDYTTVLNVYQSCASAAPDLTSAPLNLAPSPAACQSLFEKGLLSGVTLEEQAAEAQAIINAAGILPEQNELMPSHWAINVPQGIAVTYANSYSRSSVIDDLCGYSFGATNLAGEPVSLTATAEAQIFSESNGIPPTGGVNLINNDAPMGPWENRLSTPDQNLAGALCLRSLVLGRDVETGQRLRGRERVLNQRLREGIREVRASGDLGGMPAIFVTGRSDAILPPNHTSRAYYGLNRMREGRRSQLTYVEVLNAQHLDVLNGQAGFKERYIPLHYYYNQALDLMMDHLRNGSPLPPSQVVRTTPRGPGAPPIGAANLPDIAMDPAPGDRIRFRHRQVRIPD